MQAGIIISNEVEMYKDRLKNCIFKNCTLHFSPAPDVLNYLITSGNVLFIAFDINIKGIDFPALFQKIRALYDSIPSFLISDTQNSENLKATAERIIGCEITHTFSFKTNLQDFVHTVNFLPEVSHRKQRKIKKLYNTIIGNSENTEELKSFISIAAKSDLPVLLDGPTGCGKNIAAKLIHELSDRRKGKFVCIDMGVIHKELMEAVLFGVKKGAFTDACTSTIGLIELANHGTLFLDEIENAPLSLQIKLLGVLENKKIRALGDSIEKMIDFRLICATNRDIKDMIKKDEFRQDLYYRLNSFFFSIEPLKNRRSDIKVIAKYYCKKHGFEINDSALDKLSKNSWEGNVRELINVLDRAFIYSKPLSIVHAENVRFYI